MDKSKVAEAYAEVRADLSKLPGELGKVPGIMKRMISTDGLKAVRDILTGNITTGLVSLATGGYKAQAEKLRDLAEQAKNTAKELAGVGDKAGAQHENDKAAKFGKQAQVAEEMGSSVGGKVALASKVGIMAIQAIAAVAAAYFATTVMAAKQASENLKTSQLVRATGEAAGWSAEQLKHMGDELRKNSSFSQSAIAGAQQALIKHPDVKGSQYKRALDTAADVAATGSGDLAGEAQKLGEILSNLDDPLKITRDLLKDYGLQLTLSEQAALQNAAASMDIAKAQDLVLDKLSAFKGAAKEASETGTGGFDKLWSSIQAAAVSIGGINGDIGTLAAQAAKAVDKFMEFAIVKDIIEASFAPFKMVFGAIEDFIESNRADFIKWGDQINEIYHNVRDNLLELWDEFKKVSKQALDFVLGSFGSSWDEIKATVTAALDEISLLTTNFGLTAKYVWVGVQLGAQDLWDALRDGLAVIQVGFEAAWKSIAAGAEAAWDQIEEAFGGPKAKSIGEEMSKAFNDGLKEGAAKYKFGESDAAKELKSELADIRKQMLDARETVRGKRADEAARKDAANKALETPGKGTDRIPNKPFKFEFTGFEELYKKIQTSIYPSETKQFQDAAIAAAEKAVVNGAEANKKLDDIKDAIKGGAGIGP